jgi:hypothetical protein
MSRYLAVGLGLLALSSSAQDTEVKGARVSVVRQPSAVLNVTIENRHDSPLVEVQLGLTPRGTGKGLMSSTRYFGETPPNETVKPHERRVLETPLDSDFDAESATLSLVVFADGYYEGAAAAVEPWRKARQARIDDLRYWSGVFELMPRVSETDLRAYLASRLADRAGRRGQDHSGTQPPSGKLQNVLRHYPSGPEVWSRLDRLRAETQSELAVLTRQPANAPPAAGPVAAAAILTQDRVASTKLVAAIENLRTVPIEAFGLEVVDAGTGRVRSGQRTDFCVVDPDPALSGRHRIQPHEIRELPLGVKEEANVPLPLLRLSFVIFDDLIAEGNAAARAEVFRERETRAEDFAFAVAALEQAVARPVSEIQTFLIDKRAERTKQLQALGNRADSMAIDELIRQAKESLDRMLANAKDMKEGYERVRQRLVRHVGR